MEMHKTEEEKKRQIWKTHVYKGSRNCNVSAESKWAQKKTNKRKRDN